MLSEFTQSILEIERAIILHGEMVEKVVVNVMMASIEGSDDLADQIISFDDEIDKLDESITWMIQEVFSQFSPKGGDLRFLLGVPRVSAHLELIGDQCVVFAKNLKGIKGKKMQILDRLNLLPQFETVIGMTTGAINALIDRSAKRAWRAMASLDIAYKTRENNLTALAGSTFEKLPNDVLFKLVAIVNALFVMACNAADIAANVVYITHGVDVRYRRNKILEQLSAKSHANKAKESSP